jgi:hypothetical protein
MKTVALSRVLTAFLSVALMDVPPICGRLDGSKASIRKRGNLVTPYLVR